MAEKLSESSNMDTSTERHIESSTQSSLVNVQQSNNDAYFQNPIYEPDFDFNYISSTEPSLVNVQQPNNDPYFQNLIVDNPPMQQQLQNMPQFDYSQEINYFTQQNYDQYGQNKECQQSQQQMSEVTSNSNTNNLCFLNAEMHTENQLPDLTEHNDTQYNFEVTLESGVKSSDYKYSTKLKKLFVKPKVDCPFKFKTSSKPPKDSFIKVLPVSCDTHVLSDPVRRCSNHVAEDREYGGSYHFIQIRNPNCNYYPRELSMNDRLFVKIPFTGGPTGGDFQTELFKFMCVNQCLEKKAKRNLVVIFTLETPQGVIGRKTMNIRVCACPDRDFKDQEKKHDEKKHHENKHDEKSKPTTKKRKISDSSFEDDGEYVIRIKNIEHYRILSGVLKLLENKIQSNSQDSESSAVSSSSQSSDNNSITPMEKKNDPMFCVSLEYLLEAFS